MALNFSQTAAYESFRPFYTAKEEWEYRLQMIKEAKEYLYISTYYIDYKYYGNIFLNELLQAAQRGVKILLLIDTFGQKLGNLAEGKKDTQAVADLLGKLAQNGAIVKYYQPKFFIAKMSGAGHHFKIQVNEKKTALISSGNISHRSYDQWNEFSFLIKGEIVSHLIQSFFSLFEQKNNFPEKGQAKTQANKTGETSNIEYLFCDPNFSSKKTHPFFFKEKNCISEKITTLINQSKKEIQLCSFYFKPTKKILDALLSAAAKGVKIKIFHSHRNALPETNIAWIGSAIEYGQLLKKGISIFENLNGEHSKILIIDKEKVIWGSYNLEHQAHDRLAECMLVSSDKKIIRQISKFISIIEQNPLSIRVKEDYKKDLPFHLIIKKNLLIPFKKWL